MGELESYLEGGGLQGEEIVKSTLFCKVHYVLNSDIIICNCSEASNEDEALLFLALLVENPLYCIMEIL